MSPEEIKRRIDEEIPTLTKEEQKIENDKLFANLILATYKSRLKDKDSS